MPTSNPVPSQDPSDLLFNAGKLDEVVNGTANSFTDRLGVARRTVAGMNADFDAQLADAESDLNVYRADAAASAAEALGYLQTIRVTSYGAYASDPATDPLGNPPTVGDEYFNTTANLLKRWNGTTWQASDINTANLAASSGSSLVGYDGGTVQDVLDAVTGPNGAASVGYTPSGTGAVATTVQEALRASSTKLTDHLTFAEALAIQTRISTTDFTEKIQKAIDATPSGGTLEINIPGVALIDTLPSVKVESDLGSNWTYGGLMINKPMRVIGNKDFRLKIKDFSTAWTSQDVGDSICAVIVNSSNVHVDGWNVDCNANQHYELNGIHKYWETGPTQKRPPCGFTVTVSRTQSNVRDVLIENCSIYNPLAGITFAGNAVDASRAAFLSGNLETGVVKDCVSRNNRVFNARGNGVLFNMGTDNCWSESDVFVDGMYHAIRIYSRAINCGGRNGRAHVNPDRIIARYNSSDLGYWRTTDTTSPEFKIVRQGYKVGGADSYSPAYGYSVVNCGFTNCVNLHEKNSAGDSSYFDVTSVYLASFSLNSLKNCFVKKCESYGAYVGVTLFYDGVSPANAPGISVTGNTINQSLFRDMSNYGVKNAVVTGNTININESISYTSAYFKDADGLIFDGNTYNGTPFGNPLDTYAFYIAGTANNIKLGDNRFSKEIPLSRRYVQDGASTPASLWPKRVLNFVSASVISGGALENGWANAYGSPLEGQENQLRILSDGSIHIRLNVSGVAAAANTVATLNPQFRPGVSVGFVAHNRTNGDSYWGRVLTDGRVQITMSTYPTAGTTELLLDVYYDVLV